jgi:hypothetical protein
MGISVGLGKVFDIIWKLQPQRVLVSMSSNTIKYDLIKSAQND